MMASSVSWPWNSRTRSESDGAFLSCAGRRIGGSRKTSGSIWLGTGLLVQEG